jgi:nucleotide-binding universal stress UspA family protein
MLTVGNYGDALCAPRPDASTANYAAESAPARMRYAALISMIRTEIERPRRRLTMETIVIAVDGSPASDEAVLFGVELAEEHDAQVVFVHVVPALDMVPLNGFGLAGGLPHEPTFHDAMILDDAMSIAELHGVRSRPKRLTGDTVDEIVAYADNIDADMIVVGSRGHGGLASALLGSVSRGVLSESKRPVVVVRSDAKTRDTKQLAARTHS